ncbi:hypothetical protein IIA15_08090 [candidate division TA06 bacterium]|nr:hypothetical protein [candidate division TA06 bacterium]
MARWKNVAIIGVGLIGGSIGLAIRGRGVADEVIGIGRSKQSLRAAKQIGVLCHKGHNLGNLLQFLWRGSEGNHPHPRRGGGTRPMTSIKRDWTK